MKKAVLLFSIIPLAVAVVLGVYFWLDYGLIALVLYAAMLLGLPFASFVHELGHMLFGAIVGIKAKPKFSLFGSSSCQIIPKTDKNLKNKVIFTASGGLAVNAIFVILGVIAMFVPQVPMWLAVFMPASLYLFIINSLMCELWNGKTDGLVISEIASGDDNAKVLLAVLAVQAQVLKGKPIEEVDESLLFGLPQIREDDQAFIALTELRYEYFKAKGEEEKAQGCKARFEELKNDYQ